MKFEIWDFYLKSGNVIRAAQIVGSGEKFTFTFEGSRVVKTTWNFKAIPSRGIGCPNFIALDQIQAIVFIEFLELTEEETG